MNKITINNSPECDLLRLWVEDFDNETGYFIYPDLDGDDMVTENGYPTPRSIGNLYWKWDKLKNSGSDISISLSRWTHAVTPEIPNGDAKDMYDGDIVQITWIEGFREVTIRYVVEWFPFPEGRWCLNELGGHEGREYIPLAELQDNSRLMKSMFIVGSVWEKGL